MKISKNDDETKSKTFQHSTLTFLEVKSFSEEYLMPIKIIYELYSEFNSLRRLAKDQEQNRELHQSNTRKSPMASAFSQKRQSAKPVAGLNRADGEGKKGGIIL
jgi:hypothetical protein